MEKQAAVSPQLFLRTGPAQYVNRAGILDDAGQCIAYWGKRALISGGARALAASEARLTASLDRAGVNWQKMLFTGECSRTNIARIQAGAEKVQAGIIIGVGGGKSLDTAKQAAAELELPAVCIPTVAATCSATTALSVIYNDEGEFQKASVQARNPSLVLVDPEIITRTPGVYLRAGILDSMAKWFEGRAVSRSVPIADLHNTVAMQLAQVLYDAHKKNAAEAVRLNSEQRVDDALIQTLDAVILLTGMIQTLARGTRFTALAHPVHNGMTLMKESHEVLHGLKVGYGIMVQLCVENCPETEFNDVLAFFRQLGLEPSLKGLNLPYDRQLILRIADKAANDPDMGALYYPVTPAVVASAMERLEARLA